MTLKRLDKKRGREENKTTLTRQDKKMTRQESKRREEDNTNKKYEGFACLGQSTLGGSYKTRKREDERRRREDD